MPVHDWTRVASGIFHDFHLSWIDEIRRALNSGILPPEYYALAEQQTERLEPDILTLHGLSNRTGGDQDGPDRPGEPGGLQVAPPKVKHRIDSEDAFYRRRQRVVTVRNVSDDRVVAMVEIVSPGNKDSRRAVRGFVEKAAWLLE